MARVFLPRTEPYHQNKLYAKSLSLDDSGPDRNPQRNRNASLLWDSNCGPSFCEAAVLPFTMLPVYLIYQVILSLGLCDVQADF